MRVAVLSDIHSNVHALEAVLRDVRASGADQTWLCGDTFGYYPWAAETFRLFDAAPAVAVLGNHDGWVADTGSAPADLTGEIARRNAADLTGRCPAALTWLAGLELVRQFRLGDWDIAMAHGTPDDPLDGRYYPDDAGNHSWLPAEGEILILGQTHYPIWRTSPRGGQVLNPGSVGQPRDGNPMPSWALLDLEAGTAELRRSTYDNIATMAQLRELSWNDSVIRALDKRPKGNTERD
jgi:predicted phosphodiesterase